MDAITLLNSTDNDRIDQVLRGVVRIFETVFPDRVRGYYLIGSYGNGSAVPASDLDLGILFKDRYRDDAEPEKAIRRCQDCEAISGMLLEMWVLSEERLGQPDRLGIALQLRFSSLPICGEDP